MPLDLSLGEHSFRKLYAAWVQNIEGPLVLKVQEGKYQAYLDRSCQAMYLCLFVPSFALTCRFRNRLFKRLQTY